MLLQKNIVKKYLNMLNEEQTLKPWQQYQSYFLNEDIQANIHKIKEEQFQEGFLRELFVKVLGYTINPSPNYNLTTELKNEVGSKKADGAILLDEKVIGVIELKDHKTPDLTSIEGQAFGYKNKHKETRLVIISNFEKLRLYIDNAVEFREWDIFHMTLEEFRELYLCLAWQQVEHGIALQMKQESVSSEDQITKALYKDYSQFKRVLFADILKQNPTPDGKDEKEWQLLLFKKTQKLLDRLLFIFFAEDCGLLPPNMIMQIVEEWEQLKDLDMDVSLYERIKKHFGYLDTGYQGKKYEIFAYNGGLFKNDEVLDNLKISDDILAEHTRRLSAYDFESDVDVNILGHIFENSLSEIEEVTQQINNGEAPQTSKRKQDGVFYTPQYITKYIVENTVGRLCAEKKKKLNIVEDEYLSDQRRQLKTKQRLLDQLKEYRDWLLQLTILDPACGSGAFLNAALQFLMGEHKQIDELEKKVLGYSLEFQDVENYILENNLFGVDINEESVEIAQLALWLRTAKPHRKLNSLNENIKCGNSLISDPAIAGDKAFNWQEQFPKVFENGGFDVVIGNPPYVNMVNILDERQRKYYQRTYKTVKNKSDLYSIFTEKSSELLKSNGLLGFIFSNSWMGTDSFSAFRSFLANDVKVTKLVKLPTDVFAEATVTTILCFYTNKKPSINDVIELEEYTNNEFVSKGFGLPYKQIMESPNTSFSFERVIVLDKVDTIKLGKIASFSLGIKTSDDKRFVFEKKKDDDCFLFLRGRNIKRWNNPQNDEWLWYKPELISEKPGGRPRIFENFVVDKKIVIQDMATEINATIDTNKYLCNDKVNIIFETDRNYQMEYLVALLNSALVNIWFKKIYTSGLEIKINQLRTIPVPTISLSEQQPFVSQANTMLSLNSQLQEKRSRFLRRLNENLEGLKITTALQQFDQLDFKGLMAELKKQKIHIPVKEQDEWEDFFNERLAECQELSAKIKATDEEINNLVFDLYGLTEEERKIVMNA